MSAAKDTDLLQLPDESLVQILKFLNYKDLISLSKVCRRFKSLTCDDCFWRWQCYYYYLINSCSEGLSWKQMFVKMHKEYGRYINHYRKIRGAWSKIEIFLKHHCPSILESLQGGVTEEIIERVEDEIGHTIPSDIRLSYRIYDGQKKGHPGLLGGGMIATLMGSDRLLPIEEVALYGCYQLGWMMICYCQTTLSGHILSVSHSGPLSSSGAVYMSGRLALGARSREPVECYHIGDSFTEWFCNYAENLEKNAYYIHQEHIFRFYHEPSCVAETSGITVKPTTCFLPALSGDYNNGQFFFAYRIIMSMDKNAPSDLSCQLVSRHWVINDGNDNVEEVNGPGVVGEYPIMRPGVEFAWSSCCTFIWPFGSMRGSFRMRNLLTGAITEVECPCYNMKVPPYERVQLYGNALENSGSGSHTEEES